MANCVDPDQMPNSAASDLGLHCLQRPICPSVILSLPLIQEGQLSVSGERMCTILVNRLED